MKPQSDRLLFFRYVIPAMIGMLTAGVYTLVDGLFVGWGTGNAGLAAINVAFPLAMLIVATGELIGMGSSIELSQARGRGHARMEKRIFGNMIAAILLAAVLLPLAVLPVMRPLLRLMGADAEIMPEAWSYGVIILSGGVMQIAATALLATMRNDGRPGLAMAILVAGLIGNIVLDYLFVLHWHFGVPGSAWATIMAQGVCASLAAAYFLRRKAGLHLGRIKWRPRLFQMRRMLIAGLPGFGVQLSMALVILLHNRQALLYGGVAAVAAYAVICYAEAVITFLLQGIASGIQPLVSYLTGAGQWDRRRRMAFRALGFALLLGAAGMCLCFFGRDWIPGFFNVQDDAWRFAARGLALCSPVYLLFGFTKVAESYLQSMGRSLAASLLIYLDSCVILPATLILLPWFFGLDGVWLALPVTKMTTALLALYLWRRSAAENTVTAVREAAYS